MAEPCNLREYFHPVEQYGLAGQRVLNEHHDIVAGARHGSASETCRSIDSEGHSGVPVKIDQCRPAQTALAQSNFMKQCLLGIRNIRLSYRWEQTALLIWPRPHRS